MGVVELLSAVTSLGTTWVAGVVERKKAKTENEIAIATATTNAKIDIVRTAQQGDIAWENTALNNSGWKDEAMFIITLAPLVLCFCGDWGAGVVARGFQTVKTNIPEWWQWMIFATVGVSYGLKKWTDFMSFKKGS